MLKYLLLLSLVQVSFTLSPLGALDLSGPCPILPKSVPKTTFKGLIYLWGMNALREEPPIKLECFPVDLDKKWLDPRNGFQIVGTDNEQFYSLFLCNNATNQHKERYTITFTKEKHPSSAVVNAINKAHDDNGLPSKYILNICK